MAVIIDPETGQPTSGGSIVDTGAATGPGGSAAQGDWFTANEPTYTRDQLEQMARASGVTPDPSDIEVVTSGRLHGADAIKWYKDRISARAGTGGLSAAAAPASGLAGLGGGSYDVPAFGETYTALERPSYLQGAYTPPAWTGGDFVAPTRPDVLSRPFAAPTEADLEASPGYLAMQQATQRGLERTAAARGSVLSGGFIGRTLPRALAENAQGAYQNLYNQALAGRQQQQSEYQTAVDDAFKAYQQKYGIFSDTANRELGARNVNESAFQADQASNLNQFQTRFNQYQAAINNARNARNDFFGNNIDYLRLGLDATKAGAPNQQ